MLPDPFFNLGNFCRWFHAFSKAVDESVRPKMLSNKIAIVLRFTLTPLPYDIA